MKGGMWRLVGSVILIAVAVFAKAGMRAAFRPDPRSAEIASMGRESVLGVDDPNPARARDRETLNAIVDNAFSEVCRRNAERTFARKYPELHTGSSGTASQGESNLEEARQRYSLLVGRGYAPASLQAAIRHRLELQCSIVAERFPIDGDLRESVLADLFPRR
jgi:hypothetical protein